MNANRLIHAAVGIAVAAIFAWAPSTHAQTICGLPAGAYTTGNCTMATPFLPLDPALQPKFVNELPVPIFYEPDKSKFPGTDFYEIQMKEVTNPGVAFPQPPGGAVPAGRQWLGLCDPLFVGPTGACTNPIFTEVWGYGQINNPAYALNGITTYPSMSFKATKGTPVKVRWYNNLTANNHLFCKSPTDANTPCAIDRTLMGTKLAAGEKLNPYGVKMQADNAMVVHLHGGEIPPDSDGFAELWIGNPTTAAAYGPGGPYYTSPTPLIANDGTPVPGVTSNIDPAFVPPPVDGMQTDASYATANEDPALSLISSVYAPDQLIRPVGNSIFYNYPMVQNAATIWYHDHALGKTRINVVAGPAGYFYITDPLVEGPLYATGALPPTGDCAVGGILAGGGGGGNCYDIPIVFQDRDFNADGSINYPNGLGQANPAVAGWNLLMPGVNPTIHPQWVPEYFAGHAVVNGAIWPKLTVEPRPYRFRLLDGSNARCYTLDLKIPGALVQPNFTVIGSDQGYLPQGVVVNTLTMCPGERYDVVVDFTGLAGQQVFVENSAAAPFPAGPKPSGNRVFGQMGQLVRFDVRKPLNPSVPAAPYVIKPLVAATPLVATPTAPVRELVLNEVLDPVTAFPLRVQIDAKRFEDPVTETPKRGTTEIWKIANTTADAHPMHLHLVQFQVVSRQKFNVNQYGRDTGLVNVNIGGAFTKLPIAPYLMGQPSLPLPQEGGFKDTAISYPGEVLTLIAKWDGGWPDTPNPANPAAPYYEPVTSGPYVWHCHIVDHEDNEMMRPSLVIP